MNAHAASVALAGTGAQGEVYSAYWIQRSEDPEKEPVRRPVAVKKFNRAQESVQEVQMHLNVGVDDHIVQLKALCRHGSAVYLIMEYFPR
jgi:serine/threonine protein kinase